MGKVFAETDRMPPFLWKMATGGLRRIFEAVLGSRKEMHNMSMIRPKGQGVFH